MQQLERMESRIEAVDRKIDVSFRAFKDSIQVKHDENTKELSAIRDNQNELQFSLRFAKWALGTGIFSLITTFAAVTSVAMTIWGKHP